MTLDHEHKYMLRAKRCLKVNSYKHQRHAKFLGLIAPNLSIKNLFYVIFLA